MLFGEHAVLYGCPAIVGAVSARVTVCATAGSHGRLKIRSDLGQLDVPLRDPPPPPPAFRFAQTAACSAACERLEGLELAIKSEMPPTVGLGTSAAVTVAVLAATLLVGGEEPSGERLLAEGREIIRKVQGGVGSGADVAASAFGGACLYHADCEKPERLPCLPDLLVVYAGYKTPTSEVIRRVAAARSVDAPRYDAIFAAIGRIAEAAAAAFRSCDVQAIGRLANEGHEQMAALGVCDDMLESIVAALRATPGVCGAKISGSGLGDCAIGFGACSGYQGPGAVVNVSLSGRGAEWSFL